MSLNNVLLTGGRGFVGGAIVRALNNKHPECVITVLDKAPVGAKTRQSPNVRHIQVDITQQEDVKNAFLSTRPDIVIHTAGLIPPLSERYQRRLEQEVLKVNVEGTRNVLIAAHEVGSKAFIYTSSCCVVTDDLNGSFANIDETWPVSPKSSIYGESKMYAEAVVLSMNSPERATCILRPSVIFGEGDQQLIPSIYACISKGETPFIVGDAMNLWDTIYIENVADAHVLAVENLISSKTAAGQIFFIQNCEPVPFRDFCLEVWKNFGHIPPYEVTIPKSLGQVMGLLVEWFTWFSGMPVTLSRGSVLDACAIRYASGEKARRILGFRPKVGLEEGIRRSCEFYLRTKIRERVKDPTSRRQAGSI